MFISGALPGEGGMEFMPGQSLSFQARLLAVLVTPGDPNPFSIHRMRTVTEPTPRRMKYTVLLHKTVIRCH